MGDYQRRDFHEALLDADAFDSLLGERQVAILNARGSPPSGGQLLRGGPTAIRRRRSEQRDQPLPKRGGRPRRPAGDAPRAARVRAESTSSVRRQTVSTDAVDESERAKTATR
jgi:hypothetical protein